jgi:hypothetical protein
MSISLNKSYLISLIPLRPLRDISVIRPGKSSVKIIKPSPKKSDLGAQLITRFSLSRLFFNKRFFLHSPIVSSKMKKSYKSPYSPYSISSFPGINHLRGSLSLSIKNILPSYPSIIRISSNSFINLPLQEGIYKPLIINNHRIFRL